MDQPRITYTIGPIHTGNLEAGIHLRDRYGLVINVNDAFLSNTPYWFPINEVTPWGHAPFFYVKRLLDFHIQVDSNVKILIHCAAGAERSPMMAFCYMMSLGFTPEEIDEKCLHGRSLSQRYYHLIKYGIVPGDLPAFYKLMNEYPTNSLMGIMARNGDPRQI